jgi:sugar phosphate permease
MGEAGAYPTITTSVFRWFPHAERGRAFGLVFFAAQLGGALAPLLLVPIQMQFGWRTAFLVLGAIGALWALFWWSSYRNNPSQATNISQQEIDEIGPPPATGTHPLPVRALLANRSVGLITLSSWTFQYAYYFILFWLPTYMVRARGFSEQETKLAALPFLIGALGNALGGVSRDIAVRRLGATWGPRVICCVGLGGAALCALAALMTANRYLALAWLGLCYGATTFQQPTNWATCIEIGRRHAGSVAGCMNTAGALGGLSSSMIFGYLVTETGSYDSVLLSIVIVLGLGAALWLLVDAKEVLRGESHDMRPTPEIA